MNSSNEQNIAKNFANMLNRHGYAFQYSSIRIAEKLFVERNSKWIFQTSEFPVELSNRSKGTRIDFILKSRGCPLYLLFECKRANPALKNWCFARAPYVRRNHTYENFLVETVTSNSEGISSKGMVLRYINEDESYHIALEVKAPESGDSDGKGYGAIEEAATQVCHGLNGLVELFHTQSLLKSGQSVVLIPVILTTASIWVSPVDLGNADIKSGELEHSQVEVKQKDWIYYQYHQSPGLKHSFPKPVSKQSEISAILDREYIRTIPVVTASAITDFLEHFDDDLHYLQDVYG
jgi:hypothetical protein